YVFFFSSRRRHTRFSRDWSSDVCSSDLPPTVAGQRPRRCSTWRSPRSPTTSTRLSRAWRRQGSSPRKPRARTPAARMTRGKRRRSEERRVGKEWRRREEGKREEKKSNRR